MTAPQRYQQWQGLLKVKPFGLLRKKFLNKNYARLLNPATADGLPLSRQCLHPCPYQKRMDAKKSNGTVALETEKQTF
ncbi:MAG: hypothetical protein IPK21_21775 [Haliscomenobacter sp.]|nr:hypothetical protein [Haliscomenobacter sp.]